MIKHTHVRVAFKKRKAVHERRVWIVTVYDTPADIMRYDCRNMRRFVETFFTPKAKNKEVIVREILEVVELSRSQVTLDEHKRQANKKMQASS